MSYKFFLKFFLISFPFLIGVYFLINGYNSIDKTNNFSILKKNDLKSEINKISNNKINLKYKDDTEKENSISFKITENKYDNYEEIIKIVEKNETFSKIISSFIESKTVKNEIIQKLNDVYDLKKLNIGQKILFYKNKNNSIEKIILPINFTTDIAIEINGEKVILKIEEAPSLVETESKKIVIISSLYEDGVKGNIPLKILSESIRLFSFDVDFQRDIQKNNEFEISYEVITNEKRKNATYGNIKYIKLNLQNSSLEYFIFFDEDGFIDYYNPEGKNVRKALLKTPLDGARLSSSFGMRKHPISGYNKLHKGVDFAAPKGTPIYAGGNGVIEFVGRNGGYGKYIRIRHNSSYKTAYAHLSSYKKGIHKGARVQQGQVIGYVGSTGNSTGPHLHYEIILDGKQINPMKMKLPSGKILKGKELEKFIKNKNSIYAEFLYNLYE